MTLHSNGTIKRKVCGAVETESAGRRQFPFIRHHQGVESASHQSF